MKKRRLNIDEGIFAITTVTKDRYPYFKDPNLCDLFVEHLKWSKQIKGFRVYGFSLLPDHLHMLIHPQEGTDISSIMHHLKKHSSRNINLLLGHTKKEKIQHAHLTLQSVERKKIHSKIKHPKFCWQASFWDHVVRDEEDLKNQLWYIWRNPEKHGLIKDYREYPYSSYMYHQDIIDQILS